MAEALCCTLKSEEEGLMGEKLEELKQYDISVSSLVLLSVLAAGFYLEKKKRCYYDFITLYLKTNYALLIQHLPLGDAEE